MAERSQYQYTALVGPVWNEPVASRLAWLPSGVWQPTRALPPNRLGDFALVQLVAAPAFDPQNLEWQPRGAVSPLPVELRRVGDFQQPLFSALYNPQRIEWVPSDRYFGREFRKSPNDFSVSTLLPIVTPAPPPTPISDTRARKRIRGPYSDPRIYEAYIKRCIAERQKPRVNVEVALLKEALVDEVEERRQTEYDEYDALIRENQLLERLLAFERTKRNLAAIAARQRQISVQIEEIMEQEAQSIIMLLDDM